MWGGVIMNNRKKLKDSEVINTDPFGSYTGISMDQTEKPVQDADDL